MKQLFHWLDHRTGYRSLMQEALYENIPGGSRWRYVWGSTLVFVFFVQVVTGLFLWMGYSPSAQTAWESVYYLQYQSDGGWLLRGIHHYAAQLMVVLLALHFLQVVIDGAYKAPREINFWVGLLLMMIVLGLALTGYLLPWDQKGYWATKVATEIAGSMGRELPEIAVGGTNYGHLTLTRFFALHAGVLPGLLILLLVVHIAVFRRHGITTRTRRGRPGQDAYFWPDQIFKDVVACLAVLLVIVLLAWQFRVELGPPADAAENYAAARPEWYFLFLFQFLKYFPGEYGKLVGAVVIPGLLVGFMFLMPFIGRNRKGHFVNVVFIMLVLFGAFLLTGLALNEDYYALRVGAKRFAGLEQVLEEIAIDLRKEGENSPFHDKDQQQQIAVYTEQNPKSTADVSADLAAYQQYQTSRGFLAAIAETKKNAERVRELAVTWDPASGQLLPSIPPIGALSLLRSDPKTQGPKLFRRHCAACHDYAGPDAETEIVTVRPLAPQTGKHVPNGAPNLYRFASRQWLRGLLNPAEIVKVHLDMAQWKVTDAPFFGNTAHATKADGMVDFVTQDLANLDQKQREKLESILVSLSADAHLKWQADADTAARANGTIAAGHQAFTETFTDYACSDCHTWGTIQDAEDAPDLTGYGSRDWLIRMISDPAHFYAEGKNDRMPAFNPPDRPTEQQLTPEKIGLLVDWLREDWRDNPETTEPTTKGTIRSNNHSKSL